MEKTISIPLKDIFDLSINTNHSSFTKSFVQKHKGNIPVYSASKDPNLVSYGFVQDNLKGIKYFKNCLTWNIDGSIGKAFYRKRRFSLSEKVIPLIIKKEHQSRIDYDYVKYELEKEAVKKGFSFSHKAGKGKIAEINIEFPTKKEGNIYVLDIVKQRKKSERYKGLDSFKYELNKIKQDLEKIKLVINEKDIKKYITINLGNKKYFKVDNGERVTKKQISLVKGEIPFYSSSRYKNEVLGYVSDNIKKIVPKAKKFNGKVITINADATDYRAFYRDEEFYANDVCNVIKIIDAKIDYGYIQFELITQISTMGLHWGNKLYKEKLKQIQVRIPLNKKGDLDINKQREIAKKYQIGEDTRERLINELKSLINVKVDINK